MNQPDKGKQVYCPANTAVGSSKWYCDRCRQRHMCTYLRLNKVTKQNDFCPPLAEISDGNVPCKEPLASEVIGQGYEAFANRDYKEVLITNMETKERIYSMCIDGIKAMEVGSDRQTMKKAILSMLWFEIPKKDIRHILRIGRTLFYDIIQEAKKEFGK